jgi:SAM-dependent methyltransferase
MSNLDMRWADQYPLPPVGNMMRPGNEARGVFIRQGTRMFAAIERCIEEHGFQKPIRELDILDFGCGNGRVALPFFHKHGRPNACVDVDPAVIAYLAKTIPGANPLAVQYQPPLPYPDASFDVVYSISVWTHLPLELQHDWLREIVRILRRGGLALITTSSYSALKARRDQLPEWRDVTDEELRRQGHIFKTTPATPGVTGTYGYAAHDPEWIRTDWSQYFRVRETKVSAIEGVQDINVLVKSG